MLCDNNFPPVMFYFIELQGDWSDLSILFEEMRVKSSMKELSKAASLRFEDYGMLDALVVLSENEIQVR